MCNCTSWMRHLAQARNPYSRSWLWIPGSLVSLAPRNDIFRNPSRANAFLPIYRQSGEMAMASASEKNPLHHTQKMKKRLEETVTHLRQDIDKVDEPQL